MAKSVEAEAYLNIAAPRFVHSAVHTAAAEQLTTAATYVRQAVVRQLRQDGLLNPSEQVQR